MKEYSSIKKKYAEKIFKEFKTYGCKPIDTSLVVNEKLIKEYGDRKVNATL